MSDLQIFGCPLDSTSVAALESRFAADGIDALVVPAADPTGTGLWGLLPPWLAALALPPEQTAAIVLRRAEPVPPSDVGRTAYDLACAGRLAVATDLQAGERTLLLPALTPREAPALPAWQRRAIDDIGTRCAAGHDDDVAALQAGLLQIADRLEDSHSRSQGVEGLGARRAGDYWHAVHHRREPDYGNARYWFRRVGPHPVLRELAADAESLAASMPVPREALSELVSAGQLDPLAFVDLAEHCPRTRDASLTAFAEALQFREMLRLLAATARDAEALQG
ncbi:MAG: hypothetical protein KF774_08655 [Planctomyces sp.]|nr:hypothetical protein [Planctomyces sp.]